MRGRRLGTNSLILAFVLILSASCKTEDDGGGSNANSSDADANRASIPVYGKKSELPECTKETESNLAYVKEEQAFYICSDERWVFQSAKGADGEPGAVISPIAEQWRKVWKQLVMSSVYIESRFEAVNGSGNGCNGVRFESGSGYIVDSNLVVTNGHVAPKQLDDDNCGTMKLKRVRVWYPVESNGDTKHLSRGDDGSASRIDRSLEADYDTVILDVDTGQRDAMPLSEDGFVADSVDDGNGTKIGDDALQIGYSGGTTFPHFATGRITQIAKTDESGFLASLVNSGLVGKGVHVLAYDLVSGSGSSGGPVVDLRGKVVGTNFAGNSEEADTEFGYAIPVQSLVDQLKEDRQWENIPSD